MSDQCPLFAKELMRAAVSATVKWIVQHDYEIANESEFCLLLFHQLLLLGPEHGCNTSRIRSEVKRYRNVRQKRQVALSIDIGIAHTAETSQEFVLCAEAKSWIRPNIKNGAFSQNSSTSKRNQCIRDAERLLALQKTGFNNSSCLLVYEQGSSHLRRRLAEEFQQRSIAFDALWMDTGRPSMGRRKEHVGLIWLDAAN